MSQPGRPCRPLHNSARTRVSLQWHHIPPSPPTHGVPSQRGGKSEKLNPSLCRTRSLHPSPNPHPCTPFHTQRICPTDGALFTDGPRLPLPSPLGPSPDHPCDT